MGLDAVAQGGIGRHEQDAPCAQHNDQDVVHAQPPRFRGQSLSVPPSRMEKPCA